MVFLPKTCNTSRRQLLLSVLIWISLRDEEYLGINWDPQARAAFEIRLISWCGWGWKSWIICWKGEKCRRRKFDILAPLSAQSSPAEPLWGWHFESNQNFSIPTWFSLSRAWEVLIWYCALNQTPRPWQQNWTFTALFLPWIGNIRNVTSLYFYVSNQLHKPPVIYWLLSHTYRFWRRFFPLQGDFYNFVPDS